MDQTSQHSINPVTCPRPQVDGAKTDDISLATPPFVGTAERYFDLEPVRKPEDGWGSTGARGSGRPEPRHERGMAWSMVTERHAVDSLLYADEVEVVGLVKGIQHNGKRGVIVKQLDPETGRVQVVLKGEPGDNKPGEWVQVPGGETRGGASLIPPPWAAVVSSAAET